MSSANRLRWGKREVGRSECEFSIAASMGYHKLSALKQHNFIIFQFRKSEVHKGSLWAKTKASKGLPSFPEALGENSLPCLLLLVEAAQIP